jgi:cytochrome c
MKNPTQPFLLALLVLGLSLSLPGVSADLERGELLFQTCAACHTPLGDGLGPDLHGVFGHPAGQVEGFNYSEPLKHSGLTWNAGTLRKFLANPQQVVKGTTMTFPGYQSPADLDNVIAYLKTLK